MVRVVKTKVEIEGRVHEETVVIERDEPQAWEEGREFATVGKPANRVDAHARVTGAAHYTHDIHPPGMLYGAVLRSPHPHARILEIDTSDAEKIPGVRAVISMKNIPAIPWYSGVGHLLDEVVRFAGEEVAAVAADDMDTARAGVRAIKVKYEVLPFVASMEEAVLSSAPQVHPNGNVLNAENYTRGDVDTALKSADVVVDATYSTPTALHNSFESHGSVAAWEGDELTVWCSTQNLYGVRERVSKSLDMPLSKVRVICEYMGGAFGSKGPTFKDPVLAALLARQSGRPVRVVLNRYEENLLVGNRGETVQHLRIGAMKDGTLVAIDVDALYNMGAYGNWAGAVGGPSRELYRCPNVRTRVRGVRTNLGTHAAFRAPGYVEGTFALESAVDELCASTGVDPMEFRRKNYAANDPGSEQEYSSKHLLEAYDRVAELMGLDPKAPLPARGSLPSSGPWKRGIGMASQVWGGGGGPPAHALVRLNADGTVEVMCGTQDIGTGTRTALSQIVAEELSVPLDSVRFRLGDTQKGPFAPASWGSITIPSVGPAVRSAAQDARQQLLEISSYFMEVPAEHLQVAAGAVTIEGREESKRTIEEILSEIGDYMITGKGFRGPNPTQQIRTWGAQLAEVDVNVETGEVRARRVAAVHDVGRVINPKGLSSQFYGGILQGMGLALIEERIVDNRTGQVLNPNLEEYRIPTTADAPQMLVEAVGLADLNANHVGSKGAGEPPIIPTAAAIANAVFNATGIRVRNIPVTPRRMLAALDDAEQAKDEGKQR